MRDRDTPARVIRKAVSAVAPPRRCNEVDRIGAVGELTMLVNSLPLTRQRGPGPSRARPRGGQCRSPWSCRPGRSGVDRRGDRQVDRLCGFGGGSSEPQPPRRAPAKPTAIKGPAALLASRPTARLESVLGERYCVDTCRRTAAQLTEVTPAMDIGKDLRKRRQEMLDFIRKSSASPAIRRRCETSARPWARAVLDRARAPREPREGGLLSGIRRSRARSSCSTARRAG